MRLLFMICAAICDIAVLARTWHIYIYCHVLYGTPAFIQYPPNQQLRPRSKPGKKKKKNNSACFMAGLGLSDQNSAQAIARRG
jgi:hypothetical protein